MRKPRRRYTNKPGYIRKPRRTYSKKTGYIWVSIALIDKILFWPMAFD